MLSLEIAFAQDRGNNLSSLGSTGRHVLSLDKIQSPTSSFIYGVKEYLVPILGNYCCSNPE